MRIGKLLLAAALFAQASVIATDTYTQPTRPPAGVDPAKEATVWSQRPFVDGKKMLIDGVVKPWEGESEKVLSPIYDLSKSPPEKVQIGEIATMGEAEAMAALDAASKAWDRGMGEWPQATLETRIKAIEQVVVKLKSQREEIVNALMWEIAKNSKDAAAEFDRTMDFIEKTIETLRAIDMDTSKWSSVGGIQAYVRRAAIGIMLALGPFNYPFNETYATLIPALLMGNVVVMKLPNIGGLAHIITMDAYASILPPGVINFVSGSGRVTMPPLMKSGLIDVFAFIGGSKAADILVKHHPAPHRLHSFMQLEGKNLGIVMPDAPQQISVEQVVLGATSYNGQRCTAIKLVVVHKSRVKEFMKDLVDAVAKLKVGLPWEGAAITPLPEPKKPAYLKELIEDAVSKGAKVVNEAQGGGTLAGQLMTPAVVYPVTSEMRLFHEEQFGPVIPVAEYSEDEELLRHIKASPFGQQAAIFTETPASAAPIIDALSTAVGRININAQCGRSPDVLPFSGRRSSALGTMSISEALKTFSIETLVATKDSPLNSPFTTDLSSHSKFMKPLTTPTSVKSEL